VISVAADGAVRVVRVEREERRNALDVEHCGALRDAVGGALRDGARALVVTGAGSSFCAGADLDDVYEPGFRRALYEALGALSAAPVPVVAAVNGPAIGAGLQLAIACDLRVAAPGAVFSVPTARLGIAVDPWTIERLAALAGGGAARALLLGCEELDAGAALACGLVNRLGTPDDALAWARAIAELAPLTLRYSKLALDGAAGAREAFEACWASEDAAEGRRARAERRPPVFRGS
jgi:enoyl-CoA hydratase/carnithine racemase